MSEDKEIVSDETNYFSNIASMLDALVPPKEVSITDVSGKEHRLPGAIAARRQIKVFREFQAIWTHDSIKNSLDDEMDYSITSIMDSVLKVAFDEDVMNSLGTAFKEAFPNAVEGDPLDHFSIEEVVAALAPLLIRFVKRAGKTLAGIGKVTAPV